MFGKRLLFTNRDSWPVADVVSAYRSQSEVEAGTDSKIRVHVFYWVLAASILYVRGGAGPRAPRGDGGSVVHDGSLSLAAFCLSAVVLQVKTLRGRARPVRWRGACQVRGRR
jgi:hypothetical protein